MKSKIVALALALFASSTHTNQQWIQVAVYNDNTFFVENNSLNLGRDGKNILYIYANGKVSNPREYTTLQWHVALHQCKLKRGTLRIVNNEGLDLGTTPFEFDDNTSSSKIAETLCNANHLYKYFIKHNNT